MGYTLSIGDTAYYAHRNRGTVVPLGKVLEIRHQHYRENPYWTVTDSLLIEDRLGGEHWYPASHLLSESEAQWIGYSFERNS